MNETGTSALSISENAETRRRGLMVRHGAF